MTLTAAESRELHEAVIALVRATGYERKIPDRPRWREAWAAYTDSLGRLTDGTTANRTMTDHRATESAMTDSTPIPPTPPLYEATDETETPRATGVTEPAPTRNPAVTHVLRYFAAEHLPAGLIRSTSEACRDLAYAMADNLKDTPELTTGLRKLLEAKDAFVRTALDGPRDEPPRP